MPKGDPAGYLPSVVKSRKRKGQPAYQPKQAPETPRYSTRRKRGVRS